jgi:hypothetical protein
MRLCGVEVGTWQEEDIVGSITRHGTPGSGSTTSALRAMSDQPHATSFVGAIDH